MDMLNAVKSVLADVSSVKALRQSNQTDRQTDRQLCMEVSCLPNSGQVMGKTTLGVLSFELCHPLVLSDCKMNL